MTSKEAECENVDRIHLAQDRAQLQDLLNTVTNPQVPQNGCIVELA